MKLTKRTIDASSYIGENNARCVLWDDEVPGFGLRIYPGGRKSFLLSYRVLGRKRLITLGTYGVLTVEQARANARAALAKVETGDADPLADRQRARQGETIEDLCSAYMERHGNAKRSASEDRRRIDKHILPAWGKRKAASITRADVARIHHRIGKTASYEANRVLSLLSKIFSLARVWGFVPDNQANPASDIDRFQEVKRDRWLTSEELPGLARAINEERNASARHALWLYLLTGCRKTELLKAMWADIDWQRGELRLPDTKAKRVHYVPLSAPALALLREIPRIEGCPYILPGRPPSNPDQPHHHLVNISKPWARVRAAAGAEDVRLHDLRRTVGSWLAQAGNSLHLIGRVLNHTSTATTAIYARFGEDTVRAALEQHGARIMGAAGLTPEAEVTEIGTRRKA